MIAEHTVRRAAAARRKPCYRFDTALSSAVKTDGQAAPPLGAEEAAGHGPLSAELLDRMHRYWQAANYLTIGQIYLQDNPLLREPLRPEHIKPRLLGHWGTSPGLNLIYVHLNRLITERDANVIYLAGPGHGGPALVANVYLEGTYSEIYPEIGAGRRRHAAPLPPVLDARAASPATSACTTPGSIHEGGELGYVLTHAFGAAFDNPDLIVAAVVGDGEAETGPLAGSWKGDQLPQPGARRRGAADPAPQRLQDRQPDRARPGRATTTCARSSQGNGYEVHFVEGDDPLAVHQAFAAALDACYERIRTIQREAREHGVRGAPALAGDRPAHAEGLDRADGGRRHAGRGHLPRRIRCRWRASAPTPSTWPMLETWLRSYDPERLFDASGTARAGTGRPGAQRRPAHGRQPARQRRAAGRRTWTLPDFRDYAVPIERPGGQRHENTRPLGQAAARRLRPTTPRPANFRLFCPDELTSNRLGDVLEVENRCFVGPILDIDDHLSPDGRVMEVLSEHLCEGWLEGYILTGRHGLFVTYEAFAMVSASMTVQHTKWLQEAIELPWREPVPSLNVLLTSTCWRNDHNGFSHQGPGLIDVMLSKRGTVARIYLPPDANCLLSVADHCLRSRNYVNLIVIDKQPHLQYLAMDEAIEHCARGASIWEWASNDEGFEPDVVLAARGRRADDGDAGGGRVAAPAGAGPEGAGRQRRRPDDALPAGAPPARHERDRVRRPLHRRQAGGLRLPRLPAGDPRDRPRAGQRRALPRPRLQRAGHDHDPVRHGGAERDEPLPPGDRGAAAQHAPAAAGGDA